METLSRDQARRIAVRAQLLDSPRPRSMIETVQRLSLLQNDPTAAVARNAGLVLWSRLGSGFAPDELDAALSGRALVEIGLMIRPAEDVALYRAEMDDRRRAGHPWVTANDVCRRDILQRLTESGPLVAGELPDTCVVPWRSTGWTNDRNVNKMLDLLEAHGEVASCGRRGAERLWDLASRIHPDDPVPPLAEALQRRAALRLRSLGIAREKAEVGTTVRVDGLRGFWRVDDEQLADLDAPFHGRTALLSPLDRLVFDRKRMAELFDFDYALEMYKPAAQRRWGYWAMPILHGDEFVGKLDATADRAAGVLRVNAIHPDTELTSELESAIHAEIDDLADWLELRVEVT